MPESLNEENDKIIDGATNNPFKNVPEGEQNSTFYNIGDVMAKGATKEDIQALAGDGGEDNRKAFNEIIEAGRRGAGDTPSSRRR